MGCDIHFYVEKWDNYSKQWVSADKWVEEASEYDEDEGETFMVRSWRDTIYNTRNYRLFSVLADVRNDGDYTPIARPRGLPRDVSKFVKQASDRYGDDGHSHSYLTLQELKRQDWHDISLEFQEVISTLEKIRDGIHIPTGEKLYECERTDIDVRIVFWFDN